jgi:predicted CopG family antitoxin
MNYFSKLRIVILLLLFLSSCTPKKKEIHFYHWKTNFELNPSKKQLLIDLGSEKLYTKFFDVTYSGSEKGALPTATIQFKDSSAISIKELVPVVYITNEVFKKMKHVSETAQLARSISDKIERLLERKALTIHELQFDCDWSMATRENYFAFLEAMRKQVSYQKMGSPKLSATIRLHQVKYKEKTGIPPVDSSVIMFYNVGELTSEEETNSILNIEVVDTYVASLKNYPLKYDIGLPLFSWVAVFNQGKFQRLLNDVSSKDIQKLKKEGNYYHMENSGMFAERYYLYADDKLRYETVDERSLSELAKRIKKNAKQDFNIIYYQINSIVADRFSAKEIQQISDKF